MFSSWQSFYELTGEAAGALIGLLFIVVTLASRQDGEGFKVGVKLYTTPTVFHLCLVLVISALALAPGSDRGSASLVMTGCALVACVYAVSIAHRIAKASQTSHWSDFWCYGAAPAAVYLVLAAATLSAFETLAHAASAVGLTLLVLLMVAIRNAWDLVTWLAPRQTRDPS